MDAQNKQAVDVLSQGGIIIFPTDTAFGIGCRMDSQDAVKKLFSLRKRPITQATPVLVSSIGMAKKYYENPDNTVVRLMETYWPGALTIVARADVTRVCELVRGGTDTIGLRMPKYTPILEIISHLGVPVLGPSANFHGEITPYALEEVNPELLRMVDFVLPGICKGKQASTVVAVDNGNISVIRNGAIQIA